MEVALFCCFVFLESKGFLTRLDPKSTERHSCFTAIPFVYVGHVLFRRVDFLDACYYDRGSLFSEVFIILGA